MSTPSVSIVAPCRNEIRHIGAFLASVAAQDLDGMDCEVIVADGESDDGTREFLEGWQDPRVRLRVIRNSQRTVSHGLNAAVRVSRGEYIVRMDVHSTYRADYVRNCIKILLRTGAQNVGGAVRTRARNRTGQAIAAAYHSRFASGGAHFHDNDYEGYCDTVPYGCWRRSTLEQAGLFDETLVRNQDDELNFRIIRAGGKIWQSREIVSWYEPRHSLRMLWRQYYQYGYWKVAVMRKHRSAGSWRQFVPATFVAMSLLLMIAALTAALFGLNRLAVGCAGTLSVIWLLYMVAALGAAAVSAKRYGWNLLLLLPTTFATYHFSYGCGYLLGMWHWSVSGSQPASNNRSLTAISR
jgi:glycosyltransferase involved in cell wall biosynthesis